jgi:hypothetical protein
VRGHFEDNGLGAPMFVPYEPDPDEEYERLLDQLEEDKRIAESQVTFGTEVSHVAR